MFKHSLINAMYVNDLKIPIYHKYLKVVITVKM